MFSLPASAGMRQILQTVRRKRRDEKTIDVSTVDLLYGADAAAGERIGRTGQWDECRFVSFYGFQWPCTDPQERNRGPEWKPIAYTGGVPHK